VSTSAIRSLGFTRVRIPPILYSCNPERKYICKYAGKRSQAEREPTDAELRAMKLSIEKTGGAIPPLPDRD
jgi:hypothetical protein